MIFAKKKYKKNQLALALAIVVVSVVVAILALVLTNKSNEDSYQTDKQPPVLSRDALNQQMTDSYVELNDTLSREKTEHAEVQRLVKELAAKKETGKE